VSGSGAPNLEVDATGLSVALISASWHAEIMDGLRAGARAVADASGAQVSEFDVPGTFELSVVAAECAASGRFDAIVALGVVIRGGTPHFEYVCSAATQGLTAVSVEHRVPVGFGVLTCDTEAQARDRAGLPGSVEDKGGEAMASALRTAAVLASLTD
jgi:6,7-dimethyl-8-ribityllumazine synthase